MKSRTLDQAPAGYRPHSSNPWQLAMTQVSDLAQVRASALLLTGWTRRFRGPPPQAQPPAQG